MGVIGSDGNGRMIVGRGEFRRSIGNYKEKGFEAIPS